MARVLHCSTPAGGLRVKIADSFLTRALGLLVGPPLAQDEALFIAPCSSIHTIGMRYAIDVAFVDRDARVVRVFSQVRAGRIRVARGARAVLELRAGAAARQGLVRGVQLRELAAVLSP
ncbi:conserved hypothetical protein [Burkholderiales bacterium]|nr:conserved hypothetical protein [Burkholderiales bacterium]